MNFSKISSSNTILPFGPIFMQILYIYDFALGVYFLENISTHRFVHLKVGTYLGTLTSLCLDNPEIILMQSRYTNRDVYLYLVKQ